MIVEVISDEFNSLVHSESELKTFKSLYDFLDLRMPDRSQIFHSREGGHNLFLNENGGVLKVYPCRRAAHPEALPQTGNCYHYDTLPNIGLIRFPYAAVQLMPGIKICKPYEDVTPIEQRIKRELGTVDGHRTNWGYLDKKNVLLDTVDLLNLQNYEFYNEQTIEKTVQAFARYEALQQSFYDAATGQKPFKEFWADMKAAKEDRQLIAGWNDSPYCMDFEDKGNIVEAAHLYEHNQTTLHNMMS